jgi:hypothetical protein
MEGGDQSQSTVRGPERYKRNLRHSIRTLTWPYPWKSTCKAVKSVVLLDVLRRLGSEIEVAA